MKFTFTSPVDQEIVLTLDYQNERQIPRGCPKDNVFFNMYIDNGDPIAVSKQTGYAGVRFQAKGGKAHSLEVYNWADASVTSHYFLNTYAEHGKVTIADK